MARRLLRRTGGCATIAQLRIARIRTGQVSRLRAKLKTLDESWPAAARMCSNWSLGIVDYEIRAATVEHHASLCELARYLDTVNLPNDPEALHALLATSERSFRREIADPRRREYVFVLWDRNTNRAVGTSMVIGQLGRRDAPYIYFDVRREEKYSATLDRHFVHTILTTCYSYEGPTEIGGLVVHPAFRRTPGRLGTLISYVRFLFIATRRHDFLDEVLAELLPPLEADGTSHLWEAVGRRFTGMSYREADRLSKSNKEFIRGLFPDQIYATLLSREAQRMIGTVGEHTRGVETLLRRIGFTYAQRVDPFDGGPHFTCPTDDIRLVKHCEEVEVESIGAAQLGATALAARQSAEAPYFVATVASRAPSGAAVLSSVAAERLGVATGDRVWLLPFL
jgi:arginine N-succinyltransferase